MRTPEQVKEHFIELGLSIADWARTNGFSSSLVYQVLGGRKKCIRGQTHAIAVRLGLKKGIIGTLADIESPVVPEGSRKI